MLLWVLVRDSLRGSEQRWRRQKHAAMFTKRSNSATSADRRIAMKEENFVSEGAQNSKQVKVITRNKPEKTRCISAGYR